ncbi:MAG: type II toxin-antitoxin system VapC family toxin [Pirellulales bacterium]
MKLLLDTHVFLWCVTADPKLPAPFRVAIQDLANEVYLSAASFWEAVIKHGLGKLPLPSEPADYLPQQRAAHGISALPVDEGAMPHLAALAPRHRDPFDRLLVAQAMQHGLTVVTVDLDIAEYPVPLLPTMWRIALYSSAKRPS